jgi:hypothetical protein
VKDHSPFDPNQTSCCAALVPTSEVGSDELCGTATRLFSQTAFEAGDPDNTDGDSRSGLDDNCPDTTSDDFTDSDGDGIGDVCDNCPHLANQSQYDWNMDGVGDDCQPPVTGVSGPGGTSFSAMFNSYTIKTPVKITKDCSDVPSGLFETQFGPCLHIEPLATLLGSAQVCFPQPSNSTFGEVVRCDAALPTSPPSCPEPTGSTPAHRGYEYLVGGKCCELITGSESPPCGWTTNFSGGFAGGKLVDRDQDFVPDLYDNCPTVSNFDQADTNGDGIGDACEPRDAGSDAPLDAGHRSN